VILCDIREVKSLLEVDMEDHSEDKLLLFFTEMISAWIEEFLNRKLVKKSRTEFYGGTGTVKLRLRARPVFTTPTIQVYVDEGGLFGEATGAFDPTTTLLTYGDDYGLWIDQDDGTSRCGILLRNDGIWTRPFVRTQGLLTPYLGRSPGTIKVVYTAGYTPDQLPAQLRLACAMAVAKLRYLMPLGLELTSDSFGEKSISWAMSEKEPILRLVKPMLLTLRNWNFTGVN